MSEKQSFYTWKKRWQITDENAIEIVKEIFRLGGTRPVEKKQLDAATYSPFGDALDFAIELGWLKDCLNDIYKLTCSGLLMLAHRVKD